MTNVPPEADGDNAATEKRSSEDRFIGAVIDQKYRIESVLGRGGMGVVYLARHLVMERVVALKLLHQHLIEDEEFLKRFRHEAKVACRLRHKNAVTIYDFGVHETRPYLVMEYAAGRTLTNLIRSSGPFAPEVLVPLLEQVTSALAEAHRLGIVHRDLKPENILLGEGDDEGVRVLDFGIAKVMKSEGGTNTITTQAGVFFGTPGYASPEQVLGKELDPRSDIYALGVILYEALSGKTPFTSPSLMELLMKHVNEKPRSLLEDHPRLSPAVDAVVLRCLAKDPAERFQNVSELFSAFEQAVKGPGQQKQGETEKRGGGFVVKWAHVTGAAVALLIFAIYGAIIESKKDAEKTTEQQAKEASITSTTLTVVSLATVTTVPLTTVPPLAPTTTIEVPVYVPPTLPPETIPTTPPTTLPTVTVTTLPAVTTTMPELSPTTTLASSASTTTLPTSKTAEQSFREGHRLYASRRYAEAIPHLQAAIQKNPSHVKARLALGTCFLRTGRIEEARGQYLEAVRQKPNLAPAHFELACLYALSSRPNEALDSLERAIRIDSEVRLWARSEKDLATLRGNARYEQLVSARRGAPPPPPQETTRTPPPETPRNRGRNGTDGAVESLERLGNEMQRLLRF